MKFDVSKLKEMNELDFEQVANWPFEVKIVVAVIEAIAIGILAFYLLVNDKLPQLQLEQENEAKLAASYQAKYRIAANLAAYEEQLTRLQADFSSMLRSLPTDDETPGLLDDITYVGTSAGLKFRMLSWLPEVPKEFYTELPIQMEVEGNYHNFGQFVSNVAALPRIVTVHNFSIKQDGDVLKLAMHAKTYRTNASANSTAGVTP
ncbi:type 4a pilus biogenesis protein PilO [Neptunicella marina]|uniref:Type 4a pilus biogenesis protein PilO n=1 Tax=Neptunicella marina TaxID=2125989 RepID=A0A8J6M421_9ALTE|nr:type 4a pilus biogenesis protein PilO [Neptunicella marina]MBC3767617.1 type 4a pilus biogenesis protein PilO [Neptunicella marina]